MNRLIKRKDLAKKVTKVSELDYELRNLERFEEVKKSCWDKLFMWKAGKPKRKGYESSLVLKTYHGNIGAELRASKRLEKAISNAIVEEKQLLEKEIIELLREN